MWVPLLALTSSVLIAGTCSNEWCKPIMRDWKRPNFDAATFLDPAGCPLAVRLDEW